MFEFQVKFSGGSVQCLSHHLGRADRPGPARLPHQPQLRRQEGRLLPAPFHRRRQSPDARRRRKEHHRRAVRIGRSSVRRQRRRRR